MCWAQAGRSAADSSAVYEAAVYGAMCGDPALMIPAACSDWEVAPAPDAPHLVVWAVSDFKSCGNLDGAARVPRLCGI